jgi:hypothetical protein
LSEPSATTRPEEVTVQHAIDHYITDMAYLVTLPDYDEDDKAEMLARAERLARPQPDPIAILKAHYASVTARIEREHDYPLDSDGEYVGDVRECACGLIVDGFYEYTDHLITLFEEASR